MLFIYEYYVILIHWLTHKTTYMIQLIDLILMIGMVDIWTTCMIHAVMD